MFLEAAFPLICIILIFCFVASIQLGFMFNYRTERTQVWVAESGFW